jgi:hypothetical protein
MAQEISRGSIFGRLGTGIGQGLSEQIPKEIERHRLQSGLEDVGNAKDLTPFQRFAKLSGVPGITPQAIQSGTELLKQEAQGRALDKSINEQRVNPFTQQKKNGDFTKSNASPSITKQKHLEEVQEGYIPPTQDEIFEDAGRRYNENPALYNNDPQKAIQAAETAALRQEKINQAHKEQNQTLSDIQDKVVNRLKAQSDRLGAQNVPSKVYSKIEDEAIQATKSKKEGGEGLTEQQAMKKYGAKLDDIARDYKAIDTIGNWGIVQKPAKESLRAMNSLQDKFSKRGETEEFADSLIADNKISPMTAYAIAEPIRRQNKLNTEIKNIPSINNKPTQIGRMGLGIKIPEKEDVRKKTLEVSEKIGPLISKGGGSPLAVAYELKKKGYDPSEWLEYVRRNRDELKLTEEQGRQLDKPDSLTGTINDWWLSSFTGLE